jgi:hypothetical protein
MICERIAECETYHLLESELSGWKPNGGVCPFMQARILFRDMHRDLGAWGSVKSPHWLVKDLFNLEDEFYGRKEYVT